MSHADETQALINANRPETRIFNLLEIGEEDTHPLIKEAYHRAVVGRSSEGLPRDIWVLVEAAYELAVTHYDNEGNNITELMDKL